MAANELTLFLLPCTPVFGRSIVFFAVGIFDWLWVFNKLRLIETYNGTQRLCWPASLLQFLLSRPCWTCIAVSPLPQSVSVECIPEFRCVILVSVTRGIGTKFWSNPTGKLSPGSTPARWSDAAPTVHKSPSRRLESPMRRLISTFRLRVCSGFNSG